VKKKNPRLKKKSRAAKRAPAKRPVVPTPPPLPESPYWIRDEVLAYLRIGDPCTLYRWRLRYPDFPKPLGVGRRMRFLKTDIIEWAKDHVITRTVKKK
jgi:predicted DNA-binding transcriptional regulator AlpA